MFRLGRLSRGQGLTELVNDALVVAWVRWHEQVGEQALLAPRVHAEIFKKNIDILGTISSHDGKLARDADWKKVKDRVSMFSTLSNVSFPRPDIPLGDLSLHFVQRRRIVQPEKERHPPQCLHLGYSGSKNGVDESWKVNGSVSCGYERRDNHASIMSARPVQNVLPTGRLLAIDPLAKFTRGILEPGKQFIDCLFGLGLESRPLSFFRTARVCMWHEAVFMLQLLTENVKRFVEPCRQNHVVCLK